MTITDKFARQVKHSVRRPATSTQTAMACTCWLSRAENTGD
jgi:hypothetical protein